MMVCFTRIDIATVGASLSSTLYYVAPVDAVGIGYAYFSFNAIDQNGSTSVPSAVYISIAANNAPEAQSAVLLTTQETTSSPIILTGSDADLADANSLQLILTGLPTKGYLIMNSANVTAVPTPVTGPISYYTAQRGSDRFFFKVVDQLGASSAVKLVPITIAAVNHAPTVTFAGTGISVPEIYNYTINLISASDPDGDVVTIYISSLPSIGTLYQMDGTPITSANTPITDPTYQLIYAPIPVPYDQLTSFSFYGNDSIGALNSITPTIVALINISHVNRPPVAYPSLIVLEYGPSNFSITANVTDIDTPIDKLEIIIQSLPDSDMGILTDTSGMPIVAGQIVKHPFNMTFAPNVTAVGSTATIFYVTDGINVSSSVSYGIIINAAKNTAPVAFVAASYTAVHGVPLAISLDVHDVDFHEMFTYVVTATMNGSGILTDGSSKTLTPPTFNLTVLQNAWFYATSAMVMFTAPGSAVNKSDYLTLSYLVYDSFGAPSGTVSTTVNIAPNNIPVATFSTIITLLEEGNSAAFKLTGFDNDIFT